MIALLVLAALLTAGCVPKKVGKGGGNAALQNAAPAHDQEMIQAPAMRPGDSWVYYRAKGRDAMQTEREQVIRILADGSYYLRLVPELGEEKVIEFSPQGRLVAYAENGKRSVVDKPMHRLSFPLFVGKTWTDDCQGRSIEGDVHGYASSYRVEGWEEVTTRGGNFRALAVQRTVRRDDGRSGEERFWYAPAAKRVVLSRPDWKQGTELLSCNLNPLNKEKSE
jgi:hypothetical protein